MPTPLWNKHSEKRCDRVVRDISGGRCKQVTAAVFDMKSAELLFGPAGRNVLSAMDLVPAATAIQHNYQLVITDKIEACQARSASIAPRPGRLDLPSRYTATG